MIFKPIVAVVNSFTQFVPGHVHLKGHGATGGARDRGRRRRNKEFNTIAVDDGIAMSHDGMLYSLPSRDIIADSVGMVNAHCADAMVCISNCDKITPGMLMANHAHQYSGRLCVGRPHGGGQGQAGHAGHTPDVQEARSDRCHGHGGR